MFQVPDHCIGLYLEGLKEMKAVTEVDHIMESNNWTYGFSCGYADGKRDKLEGLKKVYRWTIGTEYTQGYHKGYSEF